MNAKDKAKQLVNAFFYADNADVNSIITISVAKQCALIAVDEIIDNEKIDNLEDNNLSYWQEVKSEIEKL
jgi:hypothetical protein